MTWLRLMPSWNRWIQSILPIASWQLEICCQAFAHISVPVGEGVSFSIKRKQFREANSHIHAICDPLPRYRFIMSAVAHNTINWNAGTRGTRYDKYLISLKQGHLHFQMCLFRAPTDVPCLATHPHRNLNKILWLHALVNGSCVTPGECLFSFFFILSPLL